MQLGGKDWDERIVNYAAELFVEEFGNDPRNDPQSHQDLLLAAEEGKKDLTRRLSTRFAVNHMGKRLTVELSRERFEEMTADLLYRTESRVDRVIRQSHLTWDQVDNTLLVGGSSRMPMVSGMLGRVTGKKPDESLSVDEVVAHGAAIHAAILQVAGKKDEDAEAIVLEEEAADSDVLVLQGDEEADAVVLADVETVSVAPPAESVADKPPLALQQQSRSIGGHKDFEQDVSRLLLGVNTTNVNAHSLGVIVHSTRRGDYRTSVIIPRNTALPASMSKTYGTVTDSQRMVKVKVVEGEAKDPTACIQIGECVVSPLPPGLPRGSPITVKFSYDNSGRLHVRAKDETSGLTAKSVIIRASAMTKQEIRRARETVSNTTVM